MQLPNYEDNVKKVKIDDVRPNSWNPKDKNHEKVQSIKKSIQKHGFKQPIQVRSNDGYEIIDGEQRWTAMKELGATHIYIYDNGEVEDADAMNETLWWQVQVPFDTVNLSHLVVKLEDMHMELPYSTKELAEFRGMSEFGEGGEPSDGEDDGQSKRFSIKLSHDAFAILQQALEIIKEENDPCSDSRAVELMAIEFLNSPEGTTGTGQK